MAEPSKTTEAEPSKATEVNGNSGSSKGGRPKGLGTWSQLKPTDPELRAILSDAIQNKGLTPVSAARSMGIDSSTFYRWMAADPVFAECINAASAQLKAKLASYVMQAAPIQWQAAMTMLERLWPEEYGRRDRIKHEVSGNIGLHVEPTKLGVEQAMALAALEDSLVGGDDLLLPPHDSDTTPD